MGRGYFGIGIYHGKIGSNLGTLWRTAHSLGAKIIFTIGRRYQPQATDTTKAWRSVPLFHFTTFEEFQEHRPKDCELIGIEKSDMSRPIKSFIHPERALYILGAEDTGLSDKVQKACQSVVHLPGDICLNVAVAGSSVLIDRVNRC